MRRHWLAARLAVGATTVCFGLGALLTASLVEEPLQAGRGVAFVSVFFLLTFYALIYALLSTLEDR